jgi:CRISPR system Cascade subunit CasC
MEFDFYTAVDDFRPGDNQGSDMMGTVAFQSSCFYRYACLDMDALRRNLGANEGEDTSALTKQTVDAFVRACAYAIPTGKQNSMAAQNRPSYLLAVVRENGTPQSLANAFVKPVRPNGDKSLVEASIEELERYLDRSLELWGDRVKVLACAEVDATGSSRPERIKTFDAWVAAIAQAAGRP